MKAIDFNINNKDDLPFDVVDDMHFHMRNDPIFYRKEYLPTLDNCSKCTDDSKVPGMLDKMIDRGSVDYCKKYKLDILPSKLFNPEDKSKLRAKILDTDMDSFNKGKL
jgi:hypothetical protein